MRITMTLAEVEELMLTDQRVKAVFAGADAGDIHVAVLDTDGNPVNQGVEFEISDE
jgi:hypothetical protein